MNLINLVSTAINKAEKLESKINHQILQINGMSSNKVRHFLNNIINENSRYLEIGCWKGSTICSALNNNNPNIAFGIDNWSEFTIEYGFGDVKGDFLKNIHKFISTNLIVIEENCFEIDFTKYNISNINTYFYDGNHSYDSQKNALIYYYNSLSNVFIFIVDDWEYPKVKDGTFDGIKELNLKIIYDFEGKSEDGWWNGFYISILQK